MSRLLLATVLTLSFSMMHSVIAAAVTDDQCQGEDRFHVSPHEVSLMQKQMSMSKMVSSDSNASNPVAEVKKSSGVYNWFNKDALVDAPMGVQSGWGYLSEEKFDDMVRDAVSAMDPKPAPGASVYELGCGVGGGLSLLRREYKVGQIGGRDFAENAIARAKEYFPDCASNFTVGNISSRDDTVPDESYDHVISLGAMAMYQEPEDMKQTLQEALRIARPGASLCFSHFYDPDSGGNQGSIIAPLRKSELRNLLEEANVTVDDVRFKDFKVPTQVGRYILTMRKART